MAVLLLDFFPRSSNRAAQGKTYANLILKRVDVL